MHTLPTEHYTSAAIFERERERIFGRLWLFAGLKMMVARSGAYYARSLAGTPIVLQNLGGELACFLNSCAHRNAELQPEGFGVRGFVCGYHGIRYAIDGSVASVPLEDTHFKLSSEQRSCMKLRRFALCEVGQFLFVNFASEPLPIETQFHEQLLSDLRGLSDYLDHDVICSTSTARYNWKLPGENLRDLLHPRFVHAHSLYPSFDFESMAPPPRPARGERPTLRDVSFGGPEGRAKKDLAWPWWNQLERWPEAQDLYYNWLLFPNLHIASHDGCRSFGIEQFDPLDAGSTRFVHFMLTAKRKQPIPHGDALLRGALRGARWVLDEDTKVMESVQRGMLRTSPPQQHSEYETNLSHFGRVTQELLDV